MRNKRGDAPSLVSLAVATIVIVMILVGFVVLSGIIKTISGKKSGEKILKDGEVGVGDLKDTMKDYEKLVFAEVKIREGNSVDEALESVEYGKKPIDYVSGYYGGKVDVNREAILYVP